MNRLTSFLTISLIKGCFFFYLFTVSFRFCDHFLRRDKSAVLDLTDPRRQDLSNLFCFLYFLCVYFAFDSVAVHFASHVQDWSIFHVLLLFANLTSTAHLFIMSFSFFFILSFLFQKNRCFFLFFILRIYFCFFFSFFYFSFDSRVFFRSFFFSSFPFFLRPFPLFLPFSSLFLSF